MLENKYETIFATCGFMALSKNQVTHSGGFRGSFNIVNDAAALTIIPLPRRASLNCLYGEFAARAVGLFRQTILSRVFFFCRAPRATR